MAGIRVWYIGVPLGMEKAGKIISEGVLGTSPAFHPRMCMNALGAGEVAPIALARTGPTERHGVVPPRATTPSPEQRAATFTEGPTCPAGPSPCPQLQVSAGSAVTASLLCII